MASSISDSFSFPKEEFIFIRHGQTDWSLEQGPQDLVLNKKGREDAERAALVLYQMENFAEAIIVSSKLNRTKHTANIISKLANKTFCTYENIHERVYGNYKNQNNTVESKEAFKQRVLEASFDLFQNETDAFKETKKVIVSHSGVFKVLTSYLAKEELNIGFGEVFLFTPGNDKWEVTKIE